MTRILFTCFLFFFSCLFLIGAEDTEIFFPKGTPLYRNADPSGVPEAILTGDTLAVVLETAAGNLRMGAMDKNVRMMVMPV